MKISRLLYKNHILPPFVTPFKTIVDFMQIMYPEEYENVRRLKQRKQHYIKKENEMKKINETIHQQLYLFRMKYIAPLEKCPTFYEVFDMEIVRKLEKSTKMDYLEIAKKMQRRKVHSKFIDLYKAFKKDLTPQFLNQVALIPTCLYFSAEDLAKPQEWPTLTPLERNSYEIQYLEYLQKYDQELRQLAKGQNISYEELLRLMKNEFGSKGERDIAEKMVA